MKWICIAALALGIGGTTGCAWFEKQEFHACVDYKGKRICVGRKDGAWVFSADLKKEEQDEIIAGLDQ